MNEINFELAEKYVSHSYVQQGKEARRVLEKNIRLLFEQGKIPSTGWNDLSIKHLLHEISLMDSNNFPDNCGVGEREARIASALVAQRHFYLGHGIGRSGDIAEIQPKAAGSSLLAKLANSFALDVIKMAGVKSANSCLVVPVATGMALVLTMLTLKERRPDAKYVIWPRIDQKSCFKSMLTSGLQVEVIENCLVGDHLETDIAAVKSAIEKLGKENILCVLSTTSCFAPRIPDKLEELSQICKEQDIPHVVNNAYGIQSSKCMHLIQQGNRVGRLDAFIQSTDKNFMVPVGGSIIAGFDKEFILQIGKMYPGRASASPIVDFFITMLSLGDAGYKKLLKERKELYESLKDGLKSIAEKFGERLMETKQNQVSLAITLNSIDSISQGDKKSITEFGSYLFKRSVSGTRVVTPHEVKIIGTYNFKGWGAHYDRYPSSYLTAAAAIGTSHSDIDQFLKRLDKTFRLFIKESVPAPLPNALKSSQKPHPPLRSSKSLNERSLTNNSTYKSRDRAGSLSSSISGTWPKTAKCRSNGDLDSTDSSDQSNSSSSDNSLARIKDNIRRQLLLPGEIPPDKMSFLIDI